MQRALGDCYLQARMKRKRWSVGGREDRLWSQTARSGLSHCSAPSHGPAQRSPAGFSACSLNCVNPSNVFPSEISNFIAYLEMQCKAVVQRLHPTKPLATTQGKAGADVHSPGWRPFIRRSCKTFTDTVYLSGFTLLFWKSSWTAHCNFLHRRTNWVFTMAWWPLESRLV